MPLLDLNSTVLLSLLQSPIDGGSIQNKDGCFADASGNIFPDWRGLPVLINPGKTLFDSTNIGSPVIPRRSSLINSIKNKLDSNRVVQFQCPLFIDSVKKIAKQERARARVLVVGGGNLGVGVAALYTDPDIDIVSFDVYWSDAISFIADGHDIPVTDGSFHGVWIQAVLEHVLDPSRVVAELQRVLCAGGCVYAEVPFMQMVHEGPYDFERFSHSGLRWLFRHFDELRSGSVDGPGTVLRWAIRYFVWSSTNSRNIASAVYWGLLWLSWIDRLVPESRRILSSSGFFFLGKKSDAQMEIESIVGYYRGG